MLPRSLVSLLVLPFVSEVFAFADPSMTILGKYLATNDEDQYFVDATLDLADDWHRSITKLIFNATDVCLAFEGETRNSTFESSNVLISFRIGNETEAH